MTTRLTGSNYHADDLLLNILVSAPRRLKRVLLSANQLPTKGFTSLEQAETKNTGFV